MVNCSIDDSAKCCGICGFNPVVLIATDKRVKITSTNIRLLQQQTVKPKIVLVISDKEEFIYYTNVFPDIELIYQANKPLGLKWQKGVTKDANPLIILGSDDILRIDYIETCLRLLVKGYEMIGLTSWYVLDEFRKKLYQSSYSNKNKNFPLGSGRVYSKQLLEKLKFKIFDTTANRRLDDLGYHSAVKAKANILLIREPELLSVKGNWETMNPIQACLKSKNIESELIDISILKQFNYVL